MSAMLPFRAENATGKAYCNKCRRNIPQNTAQIGVMEQVSIPSIQHSYQASVTLVYSLKTTNLNNNVAKNIILF